MQLIIVVIAGLAAGIYAFVNTKSGRCPVCGAFDPGTNHMMKHTLGQG